jgi:arylsulfatase
LAAGKISVGVTVERVGRVGRASVQVDGESYGNIDIPFLVRRHSGGNLNIGRDEGIAVSDDYAAPFEFQGRINELVIDIPKLRGPDAKQAQKEEAEVELARQ